MTLTTPSKTSAWMWRRQSSFELIARKLAVPDHEPIDVSDARLLALRQQVDAQLRPVLRPREFEQFDLDRAVGMTRGIELAASDGARFESLSPASL